MMVPEGLLRVSPQPGAGRKKKKKDNWSTLQYGELLEKIQLSLEDNHLRFICGEIHTVQTIISDHFSHPPRQSRRRPQSRGC